MSAHAHDWLAVALANSDGSVSAPCRICGAEVMITQRVIEHGFSNALGLKFADPDGLEWIILREIERDYRFDELQLGPTSKVVDVGAHVGVVSLWLARRYGCTVWAFEPHPNNYRRLAANVLSNGLADHIWAARLALTADGRQVNLDSDGLSSGSYSIYTQDSPVASEPVTAMSITLEHHLKLLGDPVDLLKIDCEGAEFEILAQPELLRGRVGAIRGEFHWGAGDCAALLAAVQAVVPDTRVTFQGVQP